MMSCLDDWRGFGDNGWVNYEVGIGELVGQRDPHFALSQDVGITYGGCNLFYF